MLRTFIASAAIAGMLVSAAAFTPANADGKVLNFGIISTEATANLKQTWEPFLKDMAAKTGLDVSVDEPNANAFDRWRQALAADHALPVWNYSPARLAEIKRRGEELKQIEESRIEAQPAKLATLAAEAPTKTWADLIKDAKKAFA